MREIMSFLISTGIKMLLGLVFLGFLMIWVLAPTNLWMKNWFLHLRAQTDSTYFGEQGANMLIYSFPILIIAALSCVYLHLGKKEGADTKRENESDRLVAWRRPVVTRGPLGVVSAMEFGFLCMFVLLLIWSFSSYLAIGFSDINKEILHHSVNSSTAKKWKISYAAYYLGILGNICCAFLFYPVTRGSSILPVVGLTSEGSIKYHIWLGHMALFFFTGHGLLYVLYWALSHEMAEILKWSNTGVANVAGELSLLFGLAMWVMVLPRIRHKKFELFFYAHQLYALFMLFYVLHVGFTFFCTILPGFYLFLIDRYLRFLQSRQRVRLLSARVLPYDTLELNFSKNPGLNYSPTSVMFINVPSISSMQWHPFTVSSNCNMEPDQLSVIIKSEGSWTQKLYQILSSPSPVDRLEVSVEGPYGPSSAPFLRHDTLVMVSGGSGITPFISIIRELVFRSKALKCPIPRAVLICAFKHSHHLTMLDLLLPVNWTLEDVSHLQLQIEAFVTRDQDQDPIADDKKLVRTIWFKPNPLDEPISAVLGKQGWLWLAMIILTSFLMFVLIMGVLGRQYIYPIDHNTNEIYSYSTRAILNMLFICASVILTASMATMWNKKQNGITRKQIQNMENAAPTSSPSSWSYNADRELESLPHQSLTQDTKVHFGARPNLEKMLLECRGSSIGVLVSGPKEMRHEVARICASNLANRLHFEAISFNW